MAVAAADDATRVEPVDSASVESTPAAVRAVTAVSVDITEQKCHSLDDARIAPDSTDPPGPIPAETTDGIKLSKATAGTLNHSDSVGPSDSSIFESSKTESEVFGSALQTSASAVPEQKVAVNTVETDSEDKCRQSSTGLDRSSDIASTSSMPAMPLSSDDEGEDIREIVQDKGHPGKEAVSEEAPRAHDGPLGRKDEAVPASPTSCPGSSRAGQEVKPNAEGVEVVSSVCSANAGNGNSADDEAAARLKVEKVMRRMAAEFEEEIAGVRAKAAAEREEIDSKLKAEQAAHAKTRAASEASAADAATAMASMHQELVTLRAQLAAAKQEVIDREKAAVDMEDMHSKMKSEAAEAAAKATDALTTVLAWGLSPTH